MNITNSVSTIMSTNLKVAKSTDKVLRIQELMNENSLHHIPIVDDESEKILGLVSSTDILYFLRALDPESNEAYINDLRLKNYTVGEIMIKDVTCVKPDDSIESALEIFSQNLFHALPVVDQEEKLVGIITTHDIITNLLKK